MESLRIRITKKMIQKALIDLLEEKKIEKITVIELCKKATVNRTTFYKYYGSQHDVLYDIINEFFMELKEKTEVSDTKGLFKREMLEYLMERKKFCIIMIDKIPYESFVSKLFELSEYDTAFKNRLSDEYSNRQKECLLKYYQHGFLGIMSYWIHSDEPVSVDEVNDIMSKLSNNIMFKAGNEL